MPIGGKGKETEFGFLSLLSSCYFFLLLKKKKKNYYFAALFLQHSLPYIGKIIATPVVIIHEKLQRRTGWV